jgi:hypothetical protein
MAKRGLQVLLDALFLFWRSAMYQIKSGAVTLYLDMKYDDTTFALKGFTVDGDGNFYQTDINSYNVDNRPRVALEEHLLDKFRTLADEELTEYLEEHIRDMSIYTPAEDGFGRFWQNAGQKQNVQIYSSARYDKTIDGIVGLELNQRICLYDFVNKKVTGYIDDYNKDKSLDTTLMKVFYSMYLDQILALEQYNRGLAPPIYTELAKLNRFLNGKKSVKLVMKDGTLHDYKHHNGSEVYIGSLLHFNPEDTANPFILEDSYDLKPRFACKRPVAELDYLMYGKEKYVIDTDALRQLSATE